MEGPPSPEVRVRTGLNGGWTRWPFESLMDPVKDVSRPRLLLGVRRHDIEPVEEPVEGTSPSPTTDDPSTGSTYVFHLAPGRRRIAL